MDKIVKKIQEIVIDNADTENIEIDDLSGKKLVEDLGYDSIKLIHLICELEERLGISFEGVEKMVEAFETYDSVVNLVLNLMKGNK